MCRRIYLTGQAHVAVERVGDDDLPAVDLFVFQIVFPAVGISQDENAAGQCENDAKDDERLRADAEEKRRDNAEEEE